MIHNPQVMRDYLLQRLSLSELRAIYEELNPMDRSIVLDYWDGGDFIREIKLADTTEIERGQYRR